MHLRGAVVRAAEDPNAGDAFAALLGRQTHHIARRCEGDARQLSHAPAHLVLEQDPAGADEHHSTRRLPQPVATEVQARIAQHVARRRAASAERRGHPGKQLFERLLAAREQGVRVMSLRYAAAVLRRSR
ncbi:MAG TPA: hypothetical protein VIZ64_01490 [Dokdonella sp.]